MRLFRNTPSQLIYSHFPWGWAIFLGGILCFCTASLVIVTSMQGITGLAALLPMTIAFLSALILVRPVKITFDAVSKTAKVKTTTLLGQFQVAYTLVPHTRIELDRFTSRGRALTRQAIYIPSGESAGRFAIGRAIGGKGNQTLAPILNSWLQEAF